LAGATFRCEICGRKLVQGNQILHCPDDECGQMYCPYCGADTYVACPHNLACMADGTHWEVRPFEGMTIPKVPDRLARDVERADEPARSVFAGMYPVWEVYRESAGDQRVSIWLELNLFPVLLPYLTVPIRTHAWENPRWMAGYYGVVNYAVPLITARAQLVDLLAQIGERFKELEAALLEEPCCD
jgi:hypothetical protein